MKKSLTKRDKKEIAAHMERMTKETSLAEFMKVGAQMFIQSAVEEELAIYLQRGYYERHGLGQGHRNGTKPRTIKTGVGDIGIKMPQVRGAGAPFHSEILPPRLTRTEELTQMIPLLYMHGLSTRRVKKAVGKVIGARGLSHQNVLRISGKLVEEFKQWRLRDLSDLEVIYMVLDGVRLGVRCDTKEKEAVLVAWGFLSDGRRELLGVNLGSQESYSAWKGFLEDMVKRGLKEPLLVTIDGCVGLNKAVSEVLPSSEIQRCTKHRMENVLDKTLKVDHVKVKESLRKIFYASTYEHALEALEIFKKQWGAKYPSARDCLLDGIEDCLTYYRYPYAHWKRLRTTNVVERSFKEVKRRTKTIGRFQDEERALTMVYWRLRDLNWNGVSMTKETKSIIESIKVARLNVIAA